MQAVGILAGGHSEASSEEIVHRPFGTWVYGGCLLGGCSTTNHAVQIVNHLMKCYPSHMPVVAAVWSEVDASVATVVV